jgi:hypothetical protein
VSYGKHIGDELRILRRRFYQRRLGRTAKRRDYFAQRHRASYVSRLRPNGSGYRREVVRSDGKKFPSITAAAASVGARSHSVIHRAITRGIPSFGYHWSAAA